MRFTRAVLVLAFCGSVSALAQAPSAAVSAYLKLPGPRAILRHVRIIDGTGAAAIEDQDILIVAGKISLILPSSSKMAVHDDTPEIDLTGRTAFPGIVGMHDHLFYIARPDADAEQGGQPPLLVPQMTFSAPRLYLAAGVTTMRTTGSVETYTDLNLKREIEANRLPGRTWM